MRTDDLITLITSSSSIDEDARLRLTQAISASAGETVTPKLTSADSLRTIYQQRRRRLAGDDIRVLHVDALLAYVDTHPGEQVAGVTIEMERDCVVVWLHPAEDQFISGEILPAAISRFER